MEAVCSSVDFYWTTSVLIPEDVTPLCVLLFIIEIVFEVSCLFLVL
jgi:hypothetical protein